MLSEVWRARWSRAGFHGGQRDYRCGPAGSFAAACQGRRRVYTLTHTQTRLLGLHTLVSRQLLLIVCALTDTL